MKENTLFVFFIFFLGSVNETHRESELSAAKKTLKMYGDKQDIKALNSDISFYRFEIKQISVTSPPLR